MDFEGRSREMRVLLRGLRGSLRRPLVSRTSRDLVDRLPSCPLGVKSGPLLPLCGRYSRVGVVRGVVVDGVRPAGGGAKSFKVLNTAAVADASAVPPMIAVPVGGAPELRPETSLSPSYR
jgi:hypothetical protein